MIQDRILTIEKWRFCPKENTFQFWPQSGFRESCYRSSQNGYDGIQTTQRSFGTAISESFSYLPSMATPRRRHARKVFSLSRSEVGNADLEKSFNRALKGES